MSQEQRPCPREGCTNTLYRPELAVCVGDFHALAGMCRGKRRIGEPEAAAIEAVRGTPKYRCSVCRQFHNGRVILARAQFMALTQGAVRALRADPRVGAQGMIALADAWAPDRSERKRWYDVDQGVALVLA